MGRAWIKWMAMGVVVALALVAAVTLLSERAGSAQAVSQKDPALTLPSPQHLLRLRPDGVPRAADAALAEAASLYTGLNTKGAEVMAADRSAFAGARGSEVKAQFGSRAAARTVVVQMLFPRMLPSASLSQAVVFVGRFAHGYQVWFIAH